MQNKPLTVPDRHWRPLAAAGYAGSLDKGRGVLILDSAMQGIARQVTAPNYIPITELKNARWPLAQIKQALQTYDPETEIVVLVNVQPGKNVVRVITGRQSPRECYEHYMKS